MQGANLNGWKVLGFGIKRKSKKMKNNITYLALIICVFLLPSCGVILKKSAPKKEEVEQTQYFLTPVGEVTSYEEDSGIILVRKFGSIKYGDGSVYISTSNNGNSGTIKLTGQGNNLFFAAELLSGKVNVGDTIIRRSLNTRYKAENKGNKTPNNKLKEPVIEKPAEQPITEKLELEPELVLPNHQEILPPPIEEKIVIPVLPAPATEIPSLF